MGAEEILYFTWYRKKTLKESSPVTLEAMLGVLWERNVRDINLKRMVSY